MPELNYQFWVIYKQPSDHPNRYVARFWEGETPTARHVVSYDLGEIRRILRAYGFECCLGRDKDDDPVIVETWL